MRKCLLPAAIVMLAFAACHNQPSSSQSSADSTANTDTTAIADALPAPYATKSVNNYSNVMGWHDGKTPLAPGGLTVSALATDLKNPRWIYVLPNGDILVAESSTKSDVGKKVKDVVSGRAGSGNFGNSADRITLLRDADRDGKPELRTIFLQELNQPFGMLLLDQTFYVANTDGILQFPYKTGDTVISAKGKKILDLPAGGYNNHWTRNIISNAAGNKIYVSVGSGSNNAEHGMENEQRRANILEINPDGTGEKIYASGLRNPVGMDWAPGTKTLWTAVNERDGLGDDLVPDYMTSVKEGGFYGWPYAYWGRNPDPRMEEQQQPELVDKTIVPDLSLGAHTASLGLTFYKGKALPEKYRNGAFIGQHGSWNRSTLSGYKVVFVPFKNGKPAGSPEDFLTGFIADADKSEVYGRPVGVAVAADGALLVADDAGNTIWQVK
ncbi:Glucose/arabinose dehydrogenase, beta-propeller fold [Chitinophaga sp. YR627]|uniref:PQQ-dependent sugar dehydrogenase n=1 Tax=Chitinophaga sp. YR627 TaxID=1881041 RepID=UPI0008F07FF4|nr:sorbosone dehydrogenase family protein [Chitinophaga sp. YR627]SFN52102.1 Glucose/arabinose dehydrogenase, beta-propeller fold [Chitinophaga sp. YR627]